MQRHEKKVNFIASYLVDAVASMKSDLPHPGMSPVVVLLSKAECFPKSQTKKDKEVKTVQKSDFAL